jgi:hypothetical protein
MIRQLSFLLALVQGFIFEVNFRDLKVIFQVEIFSNNFYQKFFKDYNCSKI